MARHLTGQVRNNADTSVQMVNHASMNPMPRTLMY